MTTETIRRAVTGAVDGESDDRGSLGRDEGTPAGPSSTRVVVRVRFTGAAAGPPREIVSWGAEHRPVLDALRRPIPTDVIVEA